ncbi:MAG: hypothetical protein ABSH31_14230 [Bryobacteraceae bacterium]|jgi:hypothetical protein
MKSRFLKSVKTMLGPVALVVAMAGFSPESALAAARGGGHGGFSGGHAGGGGGHVFSAPARGFSGGRAFSGGRVVNGGRAFNGGRAYYGGSGYYGGRGYYGPGFGFGGGVYAPYGYAAPLCNPAGFYDANGVWQYYPGCAVPYGY